MNKKYIPKEEEINNLKSRGMMLITAGQIMEEKFGEEQWTIDRLIPEQSITAIGGAPGSYKTWLSLEVARCMALGETFLGQFRTIDGPVLFIDKENHLKHIQKRLRQIGLKESHLIWYHDMRDRDLSIDKEEDFNLIIETVQKFKVKVVVFDSLARIHRGDENEAKSMSLVMDRFRKITNVGTTVIFLHHFRKEGRGVKKTADSLRGSSDIFAAIDSLLVVEKIDEDNLVITQPKLRQEEPVKPFRVNIERLDKSTGELKLCYIEEYDPEGTKKNKLKEIILNLLKEKEEMSSSSIIEIITQEHNSFGEGMTRSVLKSLNEEGLIHKRKGASNSFHYSIKNSD